LSLSIEDGIHDTLIPSLDVWKNSATITSSYVSGWLAFTLSGNQKTTQC